MGRRATKAAENPWFKARMNAATYDGRLSSREGAAELLGMSVSAVSDAELGLSKCMPVDKAVLMADRYNAPYLLNHYCLNECPIGCRLPISDEVLDITHVTVRLLQNLRVDDLKEVKEKLKKDGKYAEMKFPSQDSRRWTVFGALKTVYDYIESSK